MRAMAVVDYAKPLQMIDVPEPEIRPGYVLLKILACGICYSDYKTAKGLMPYSGELRLPHIPGHEICGEVLEAESGSGWKTGDRVVVYHYWSCGSCPYCRLGKENLCSDLVGWTGFTHPGGFEERLIVPESCLLPVPDTVTDEEATTATCASGTAYRAVVTRGRVEAGQTAVIVGAGGVGLMAAQFAQLAGAQTLVVDVDQAKLKRAEQFQVAGTALADSAEALVCDHTEGLGADLVVNTVGKAAAFEQSAKMLSPGGRLVAVGYAATELACFETPSLVLGEFEIIGTRYALRYEMERVLGLFGARKLTATVSDVLTLEDANEGLERLEQGDVIGRTVLRVSS